MLSGGSKRCSPAHVKSGFAAVSSFGLSLWVGLLDFLEPAPSEGPVRTQCSMGRALEANLWSMAQVSQCSKLQSTGAPQFDRYPRRSGIQKSPTPKISPTATLSFISKQHSTLKTLTAQTARQPHPHPLSP